MNTRRPYRWRCRSTTQPARRRRTDRGSPDRGSVSVEMAVLVLPLAALMTLFAVFCARLAATRLDLNATAAFAARAASQARTPQAAHDAAVAAASADLAGHHRTCDPLTVDVDTSAFRVGGQVTVTITCTMTTANLTGLGLPGTLDGSSTAYAVIDTHRDITTGSRP